jgi:hypothetical protein
VSIYNYGKKSTTLSNLHVKMTYQCFINCQNFKSSVDIHICKFVLVEWVYLLIVHPGHSKPDCLYLYLELCDELTLDTHH